MELAGIFTRRNPNEIKAPKNDVYPYSEILNYKEKIDVLIIAHGSSGIFCESSARLAEHFNTVDSFDIHSDIERRKNLIDTSAKKGRRSAIVSSGWDPGLLSLMRLYFSSFMPYAKLTTLWGEGVSQGHSEAIRRIDGVKYAIEYTVPTDAARAAAYSKESLPREKMHKRVCYVVCEKSKECEIAKSIRNMKDYFLGYETEINFTTENDFLKNHSRLYHRAEVISTGTLNNGMAETAEMALHLDSNPDFTANILLATARAAVRMNEEGKYGAFTVFDIPPKCFASGTADGLL